MKLAPKLTDNSLMPFGQYQGEKMANIPASYLVWLYKEGVTDRAVKEYIEENMDALEAELR